jgi:hypothetical protein
MITVATQFLVGTSDQHWTDDGSIWAVKVEQVYFIEEK